MADAAVLAPDIIVGVPADGRTEHAAAVVEALTVSMPRQMPSVRWRVLVAHAAGGEPDPAAIVTRTVADGEVGEVRYALQPSDALTVPYHGMSGRARAIHAILQEVRAQQVRGCLIVDPRSAATCVELDRLVMPLLDDAADFVAPVYRRHPFAGALVHGLVYPTVRALYGGRLRYPMAVDYSCSARFIDAIVDEPIWQTEAGQIGVDLWMASTALSGGFRVAQGAVGAAGGGAPPLDLSTTMAQVVGYLFSDLERRAAVWQRIRGSRAVQIYGEPELTAEPPEVDAAALVDAFRRASRELQDVWAEVLPPLAMLQWRRLAGAPLDGFHVDPALWARTIYDFAMGHRLRVIARDHLLRSLAPLYLAWLGSFVLEARHLGPDEADARIERLAAVFEGEKPYLVSQWRWPERFRPVKLRR